MTPIFEYSFRTHPDWINHQSDPSRWSTWFRFLNFFESKIGEFILADALISITSFVIGLLGAIAIIHMPTAAAYALIGVSGVITISWIAGLIWFCRAMSGHYEGVRQDN